MRKMYGKRTLLILLTFSLIAIILINYHHSSNTPVLNNELLPPVESVLSKIYTSECHCQKDQISLNTYGDLTRLEKNKKLIQNLNFGNITFTCDIYNTFKRSEKKSKIIAFSLFGSDPKYSKDLINIAKTAKKLYPDWVMRVYHEKTINPKMKCLMECLKDDNTGEYLGNIDMCDITAIPYKDLDSSWSASYMHATKWRFLPIGDSFVEAFMSRDSDSMIMEREVNSVNVWLNSIKSGHIMRDHPYHDVPILAGMWGFYNSRDQAIAKQIYFLIVNKEIALKFNKVVNQKGQDQNFLTQYVYPLIKNKSVVHDSYLCMTFGGEPFPTRRIGLCHVGQYIYANNHCENSTDIDYFFFKKSPLCPFECRPTGHKDWVNC